MSKRLNIENKVFGRLRVIKFDHVENQSSYWLCECTCGNNIVIKGKKLTIGHTKSCGCLQTEMRKKPKAFGRKILMDYSDYVTGLVYSHYRTSAKKNNRDFDLSKDQLKKIIFSPCYYCGTEGSNYYDQHQRQRKQYEFCRYNGIDRVDNNKGYNIENVVACCNICNRAKREISIDDYIKWINKLIKYRLKHGND